MFELFEVGQTKPGPELNITDVDGNETLLVDESRLDSFEELSIALDMGLGFALDVVDEGTPGNFGLLPEVEESSEIGDDGLTLDKLEEVPVLEAVELVKPVMNAVVGLNVSQVLGTVFDGDVDITGSTGEVPDIPSEEDAGIEIPGENDGDIATFVEDLDEMRVGRREDVARVPDVTDDMLAIDDNVEIESSDDLNMGVVAPDVEAGAEASGVRLDTAEERRSKVEALRDTDDAGDACDMESGNDVVVLETTSLLLAMGSGRDIVNSALDALEPELVIVGVFPLDGDG
ncbi:hypothetical protein C7974DRAFT_407262 [Boeremia exigua]|uniref:uncharacterized protein n=1 Tax=Boeremia exigua TaxID=749465 RepID=UPI001E8CF1EA|nr:uncharacterized protein C7974DRAFT_407262 [Boeremia exigua]KAH6643523.1 hypothetical protein C7974DRAFT_407262 [Boeremia exigua]